MRSRAAWWDKANALAAAWRDVFGAELGVAGVALALAVAEHETQCGDAWAGHNWGACTKGALTAPQRAALVAAGVHAAILRQPALGALEASATAALAAAGCPVPDDAEIHVDSSPKAGAYFTLFGRFDTDEEGAKYFVEVLAKQRSTCKQILEQADRSPVSADYALAGAMYRSHYFTGFHDPSQPGGADANIADYASAIARLRPAIATALVGWTPGADPGEVAVTEPAGPDLTTTAGLQAALNAWGASPALAVDGVLGPKTKAAITAFQLAHGLAGTGVADAATLGAIRAALG